MLARAPSDRGLLLCKLAYRLVVHINWGIGGKLLRKNPYKSYIVNEMNGLSSSMKVFATIILIALGVLFGNERSSAQTLTNAGATITVTGGGLFYVSGPTVIGSGRIEGMDLSELIFDGPLDINDGGLYLNRDATGLVTGDMYISIDGVCWRYRPGVLTVEGTIRNEGELNNDG